MLALAAQLPEYPVVMGMFGVGPTLGPQPVSYTHLAKQLAYQFVSVSEYRRHKLPIEKKRRKL